VVAFAGAHVLRNASLEVDTVEYANNVTAARLVPTTPIQQQRTLVPDGTVSDVDSATWVFNLTVLQGVGGLAAALRTAAGGEVDIVYQPKIGAGQEVATFTAIAVAPDFGGEQGAYRTAEVSLPVVGAPVFSTSA